jgi:hypothetical protein
VIDVYNNIAPKWHLTRLKPWPKIEAFLSTLTEVRPSSHNGLCCS